MVMRYQVGVPMVVQLTSAAKHDHYLLKEVHLPKDSTLAMDRAYIDYARFQRLTEEGMLCDQDEEKPHIRDVILHNVCGVGWSCHPHGPESRVQERRLGACATQSGTMEQ